MKSSAKTIVNYQLMMSALKKHRIILRLRQNVCTEHVSRNGLIRESINAPSAMSQQEYRMSKSNTSTSGIRQARRQAAGENSNQSPRSVKFKPPTKNIQIAENSVRSLLEFISVVKENICLDSHSNSSHNIRQSIVDDESEEDRVYGDNDDSDESDTTIIDELSDGDMDELSDALGDFENDDESVDIPSEECIDEIESAGIAWDPLTMEDDVIQSLTSAPTVEEFRKLVDETRVAPRFGSGMNNRYQIALCAFMHLRLSMLYVTIAALGGGAVDRSHLSRSCRAIFQSMVNTHYDQHVRLLPYDTRT